jgi:hypothetical protein
MTPRGAWLVRFALLVVAVILATVALGWAGVVVVGLLFAAIDGRDSAAVEALAASAVAWALILLISALSAGARPTGMLGAAMGVPTIALPAAAMLFAAALAWSSAAVMLGLRRLVLGAAK